MHNRAQAPRIGSRLLTIVGALAFVLVTAAPALAQSPSPAPSAQASPQPNSDVVIEATPLLGGHVRPGAWAAVNVVVSNNGPAATGELRIRGSQQGQSRYGVQVDLPSGAKQQFTLYAQTALFGSRLNVDLVSGEQLLQSQQVRINSHDAFTPMIAVIAERPEGLLQPVTDASRNPNQSQVAVISLRIADLPARVEAWAAVDRLVWQDADAALLSNAQLEALRLWLGAGGELVVLGGTQGIGPIQGFDRDDVKLLPFRPTATVEAQPADLGPFVGALPSTATATPAIAGTLDHGTVLATSGDHVIAASSSYGRGTVTLVGFDPATPWLAESDAGDALWHRLLPANTIGPALNPLAIIDDSQIVFQLQNLPAVDLPPIEQLFVLLFAYIALIGPVNYLVLRRLDKREWAWVTIPALVIVFAFGSYGLGATLKGSDVIVNQITVVRAAQGTGRGIGQAYVGIYSPSRRTFDVRIPGGALLSNPASLAQFGQSETPLDVLFGDSSSQLRNFEVGFGVLRGFRAEAPADAPNIVATLRLASGKLEGSVTNESESALENVALVFAGGVQTLANLGPGESKAVSLDVTGTSFFGYGLSERIFGTTFPRDSAQARTVATRRAVVDQLFPWGSQGSSETPLLLAWRKGPVLDVDVAGENPNRVGEGLFMVPLGVTLDSQQVFADQMIQRTIVDTTATEAWADTGGMYLSRGTMTVEARPVRLEGAFRVSSLAISLTQGDVLNVRANGELIRPLPAEQQPPQDDPLTLPATAPSAAPSASGSPSAEPGSPPVVDRAPLAPWDAMPDFQLFDRTALKWMEFPHPTASRAYLIAEPERYVDASGSVLFRFVNRMDRGQFGEEQRYFQLAMRLEGTLQ